MNMQSKVERPDVKDDFRQALRRMASSVSIVTSSCEGQRAGATVSSVVSVSFEPISLLVCIHNQSLFHEVISNTDQFCINLLTTEQQDISNKFSRPASEDNLFEGPEWVERAGSPYLKDAQANFFLDKKEVCHFGSHSIFIGEVRDVIYQDDISPLIYLDGGYGAIAKP